MLRQGLAMALAGVVFSAVPVSGDSGDTPVLSAAQVARLAAERGPIRRHLEAALATPVVGVTAETLGVSLEEAPGPIASPRPAGSINYGHVLIVMALVLVVSYMAWARGWKGM